MQRKTAGRSWMREAEGRTKLREIRQTYVQQWTAVGWWWWWSEAINSILSGRMSEQSWWMFRHGILTHLKGPRIHKKSNPNPLPQKFPDHLVWYSKERSWRLVNLEWKSFIGRHAHLSDLFILRWYKPQNLWLRTTHDFSLHT